MSTYEWIAAAVLVGLCLWIKLRFAFCRECGGMHGVHDDDCASRGR